MFKLLQKYADSRSAVKFNAIYKPLYKGLTKLEYVTCLLVLVKGISKLTIAKEADVKIHAIEMRIKRAMKKLWCNDTNQLKEEIKRIEESL